MRGGVGWAGVGMRTPTAKSGGRRELLGTSPPKNKVRISSFKMLVPFFGLI